MMGTAVGTNAVLGCLLSMMWGSFVYSILGPPCMSQLGLKNDSSPHSLILDLAVSNGDADSVRLNGPKAWIPHVMGSSFVEINISQTVLLTALQVQGDPLLTGRVTGWLLETSLDCESYHTQNYSVDFVGPAQTETVLVKRMEFVSCIRLIPTQYKGETPALRLELLGCVVNDNNQCSPRVHPTAEIWLDGGGRQLNFHHEIVLVWVKVLLEVKMHADTDVAISYSKSCERWKNYEPSDMNIVSVTSSDQKSRWVTVELDVPVRVKCLRIFPPLATTLREVHTSGCNSHLTESLADLETNTELKDNESDAETASVAATMATTGTTFKTTPTTIEIPETSASAQKSTDTLFTTVSGTDINSVGDNVSRVDPSPEYSNNSTNLSLLNTPHPTEINKSSENTTVADIGTGAKASTENNTYSYNGSNRDLGNNNNSTNLNSSADSSFHNNTQTAFHNNTQTNTDGFENYNKDSIRNETNSTTSESVARLQEPNSTSTTQNLALDTLTTSGSTTSVLKNKEYNKTACGVKNSAEGLRRKRVVAGNVNSPGEWPWLVSMHFLIEFEFTRKSGFKHTCGASLVAPEWVITAAHCFADALLEGLSNLTCWRVYVGMHDLARVDNDNFVQERLIEAVYSYPSYNISAEPLLYDLALVRLNESVEINDRVSPVCLDGETDLYDGESQCYVSGWGQVSLTSPGSRYPYTAALSTMTLSKCKDMYDKLPDDNEIKQYARIESAVLCAAVGNNGEDACQGDSGGPLMCERDGRWYQAGIIAAGYLCGHKASPGLFTRIAHYSNWIRNTMELYGG